MVLWVGELGSSFCSMWSLVGLLVGHSQLGFGCNWKSNLSPQASVWHISSGRPEVLQAGQASLSTWALLIHCLSSCSAVWWLDPNKAKVKTARHLEA